MKNPWIKLIIAGIVLVLAIAGIHYQSKRLPPSKVNLVFKGWRNSGTNTYAVFDLTNTGPRSIYWNLDGAAVFETQTGWVTNSFVHFTYVTLGTPPGSNKTVEVTIPKEARKWMVRVDYYSFQKHNVRLETIQKIYASGFEKNLPRFVGSCLGGVLSLFPQPEADEHQTFSEVFTNHPPDGLADPAKSR